MSEKSGATGPAHRGLTPAMKRTLSIVGAILALGIITSLALLWSGTTADNNAASVAATPSAPATKGPAPGATPTTGSEVQTPMPGQVDPNRLPPLPNPTPRITVPLPASGQASGVLVDGFPATEMSPANDSDILNSSIATEGNTMQVTLVARTDATQENIIEYYRQTWTAEALTDAGQREGSADLVFSDAYTTVSLAFSPASGTGTVYTLYGIYKAG